ncbi:hypothetical protein ACMFMG_004433 [Clarireedia jacksonii]
MAESNKTSVVIEYSKPGVEPPIYVAGSFSSWQPLQMEFTDDAEHGRKFTRKLEVEEGKEYQYKFRLGDGNWWELDESGPTVTDESGNRNNLLAVPIKSSEPEKTESDPKEDIAEKADSSSIPSGEKDEPILEKHTEPSSTAESEDAPAVVKSDETETPAEPHAEIPTAEKHEGEHQEKSPAVKDAEPKESLPNGGHEAEDIDTHDDTHDGADDEISSRADSAVELTEASQPKLHENESFADVAKSEPASVDASASAKPEEAVEEHETVDAVSEHPHASENAEKDQAQSEPSAPAAPQEDSYAEIVQHDSADQQAPVAKEDDVEETKSEPHSSHLAQLEGDSSSDAVQDESIDKSAKESADEPVTATKKDDAEEEQSEPTEAKEESYADVIKHEPTNENVNEPATMKEEDDTEKEPLKVEDATEQEKPETGHHEKPEDNEESYANIVKHETPQDSTTKKTEGAEPDHVSLRKDVVTPEPAEVAADVADSAASLDREPPTPPMSDSEAGEIGYRRLSHTPIGEVADTAAEVAETAAKIDSPTKPTSIQLPANEDEVAKDIDDITPGSGLATPFEEQVPKFPHECNGPPTPEDIRDHHATPVQIAIRTPLFQEYDPNDPGLEPFPSDYNGIMQHVKRLETRMSEDQTSAKSISSDHLGDNEDAVLPTPSPRSLAQQGSPPLGSIAEENAEGDGQDNLTPLVDENSEVVKDPGSTNKAGKEEEEVPQTKEDEPVEESPKGTSAPSEVPERDPSPNTLEEPKPTLPDTPFVENKEITAADSAAKRLAGGQGPDITIQPATPGSSVNTADPIAKPTGTKSTSFAETNDESQLRARKQPPPKMPERSITPTSLHSVGNNDKSRNFLKAFFQVVFVDWIGGFIKKLCGGGRHTLIGHITNRLLAVSATVVVVIAPALYFFA